ncbi:kinase-like domain-containing protein [Radiomyces spectabilis]|uniref:kinase-like domain-containing protein n=1 Tax=Radiomyces spectabilis TaxID=64574 RepID=UPI00221F5EA9|nr:kinase-like domain-containing protein [Radiomyces spectabilis]KAI8369292.1 kinase-like domain-containing protein [Radiomyces spectabilis]
MQTKPCPRKKRNYKNLSLDNSPLISIRLAETSAKQQEYDKLYKELNDLEIGLELRLDLRAEDLQTLDELGSGNGGTVCKVLHMPTKTIMAKKTIYPQSQLDALDTPQSLPTSQLLNRLPPMPIQPPSSRGLAVPSKPAKSVSYHLPGSKVDPPPNSTDFSTQRHPILCSPEKRPVVNQRISVRKQIMREMQFLHDCNSEHIVSFYGAFMSGDDISICMEYMDVGSLDQIYKASGPIEMDILKKIAYAVVDGLMYLYDCHRIIHRDIKPSNILVNSAGQIKLCDFGVSGQLIDSIANTFVGTSSYMSPERILGSPYSVKSDVWSIGITLMELGLGQFPFLSAKSLSVFELLHYIVNEPVPALPPHQYPADYEQFISMCLVKDVDSRATPKELTHTAYFLSAQELKVDLRAWAQKHKQ